MKRWNAGCHDMNTDAPRRTGGIIIGLKYPGRVQHCFRIHSTSTDVECSTALRLSGWCRRQNFEIISAKQSIQ
jgi:hypothetical protein